MDQSLNQMIETKIQHPKKGSQEYGIHSSCSCWHSYGPRKSEDTTGKSAIPKERMEQGNYTSGQWFLQLKQDWS